MEQQRLVRWASSPARVPLAPFPLAPRAAQQVRLLCPKAFCACVLLEGPGQAAALRVVVDSADKAANLDPWAMPTTQARARPGAGRVLAAGGREKSGGEAG